MTGCLNVTVPAASYRAGGKRRHEKPKNAHDDEKVIIVRHYDDNLLHQIVQLDGYQIGQHEFGRVATQEKENATDNETNRKCLAFPPSQNRCDHRVQCDAGRAGHQRGSQPRVVIHQHDTENGNSHC